MSRDHRFGSMLSKRLLIGGSVLVIDVQLAKEKSSKCR